MSPTSRWEGLFCAKEVPTDATALNGVTDGPCWLFSSHHASFFFFSPNPRDIIFRISHRCTFFLCLNLDPISAQNDDLLQHECFVVALHLFMP